MAGKRHTTPLFELLGQETTESLTGRPLRGAPDKNAGDTASKSTPLPNSAPAPSSSRPAADSTSSLASQGHDPKTRAPAPPTPARNPEAQAKASAKPHPQATGKTLSPSARRTGSAAPAEQAWADSQTDYPIRIRGGLVQMPLAYAAVALVVAGAAVLGAWSFGYQAGEHKARAELALRESTLPGLTGNPPREETIPHETMGNAAETPSPETTPATNGHNGLSGENGLTVLNGSNPPAYLVNGRPVLADPRLPMHNYLQLSSGLGLTDVAAVSRIFADRGMDCFAAVDPRSLKRKDGRLFVVWAGLGFPSGEANSDNAQRYKDQVLAAGTTWKQAGGTTDFADAFWKLYKP